MPESTHKAADTAIDRVVREHAAVLERVAWGYVDNASDRDDLMQEVLTALWRALPRFRGESYSFFKSEKIALEHSLT